MPCALSRPSEETHLLLEAVSCDVRESRRGAAASRQVLGERQGIAPKGIRAIGARKRLEMAKMGD